MAGEAVRAVLNHVWSALAPLGHPCAVMGGLALAVWNHPRATRDVDLLIGIEPLAFHAVVEQLRAHGCRPRTNPPLNALGPSHFAQFLYTPPDEFYDVQFDLWLAESDLQKAALARRQTFSFPGADLPVDVLKSDDLILFKLVAARAIDRADAAMLLRENRDAIDFEYLIQWIMKLNLRPEFTQIWEEAFPGENCPNSE